MVIEKVGLLVLVNHRLNKVVVLLDDSSNVLSVVTISILVELNGLERSKLLGFILSISPVVNLG